jgi:hypothetical protein
MPPSLSLLSVARTSLLSCVRVVVCVCVCPHFDSCGGDPVCPFTSPPEISVLSCAPHAHRGSSSSPRRASHTQHRGGARGWGKGRAVGWSVGGCCAGAAFWHDHRSAGAGVLAHSKERWVASWTGKLESLSSLLVREKNLSRPGCRWHSYCNVSPDGSTPCHAYHIINRAG